jgi:methylated-DNA-[protein]-cysteine S-methyltransferase
MTRHRSKNKVSLARQLQSTLSEPSEAVLSGSRARVRNWFAGEAPLIQWGEMSSPLGPLFVGINRQGLCAVDFGRAEADFLERLDPRARLEKDAKAVHHVMAQLHEYFAGQRFNFHLSVDLSALTPFQRLVLEIASRIAPGQVWTYHRLAEELGRPECSRPVGQALARNPVPIIIPCHRVIASDGSMGGYSGGSGIEAKRWLLQLEGALLRSFSRPVKAEKTH